MQWKSPDGHNFILPKDLGETLMITGFQIHSFGLGLGNLLNVGIKHRINVIWRDGKK